MASPGRILSDLLGTLQTSLKVATNKIYSPSSGLLRAKKDDLTDATLGADGVNLYADNLSNRVRLEPKTGLAQNITLILPGQISTADTPGTNTRALTVDASGNMYVENIATASNMVYSIEYTLSWNSSVVSPVAIMTPSQGTRIESVTAEVEIAFSGYSAAPTMAVETAAHPPSYSGIVFMGVGENELTSARIYEVGCRSEIEDPAPNPIALVFALNNSTAGRVRVTIHYANPV